MTLEDQQRILEKYIAWALQNIADAINARTALERERFEKDYPAKREPTDATITRRQTEEEKLRESQGESSESDSVWIGRREAEVEAAEARKAVKRRRP